MHTYLRIPLANFHRLRYESIFILRDWEIGMRLFLLLLFYLFLFFFFVVIYIKGFYFCLVFAFANVRSLTWPNSGKKIWQAIQSGRPLEQNVPFAHSFLLNRISEIEEEKSNCFSLSFNLQYFCQHIFKMIDIIYVLGYVCVCVCA